MLFFLRNYLITWLLDYLITWLHIHIHIHIPTHTHTHICIYLYICLWRNHFNDTESIQIVPKDCRNVIFFTELLDYLITWLLDYLITYTHPHTHTHTYTHTYAYTYTYAYIARTLSDWSPRHDRSERALWPWRVRSSRAFLPGHVRSGPFFRALIQGPRRPLSAGLKIGNKKLGKLR